MVHCPDTREDRLSAGYFRGLENPHRFPRGLRAADEGREMGQFQVTADPVLSTFSFPCPSMTEVLLNQPPRAWQLFCSFVRGCQHHQPDTADLRALGGTSPLTVLWRWDEGEVLHPKPCQQRCSKALA